MLKTDSALEKLAGEHAWKFFKQHAEQRMLLFRFYLVLLAGYGAAVARSLELKTFAFLGCLSLFFCFLTCIFWSLDKRTIVLLKISEHHLKVFQDEVAHKINAPTFRMIDISDYKKVKGLSYRRSFNILFSVVFLLTFTIAAFSFYSCKRL